MVKEDDNASGASVDDEFKDNVLTTRLFIHYGNFL